MHQFYLRTHQICKMSLCGREVERVHRSGHPRTRKEGRNWSKICVWPLWMMVSTFFICEELKEKSIYSLLPPLMENDVVNGMGTQGKCFELFFLNPAKSMIETLWSTYKVNKKGIRTVLLLSSLNIFHNFLFCFCCWIWACIRLLGSFFVEVSLLLLNWEESENLPPCLFLLKLGLWSRFLSRILPCICQNVSKVFHLI